MNYEFDFETLVAYFQADGHDFVLVNGRLEESKPDAVGRNFDASFTTGDPRFLEAIKKLCSIEFTQDKDGNYSDKVVYRRHPTLPDGDMSRDHVMYTLLALYYANDLDLYNYVKLTKRRISDKFRITKDMWLWMHATIADKKAMRKYLRWTWLGSWIIPLYNRFLIWTTEVKGEYEQKHWNPMISRFAKPWTKLVRKMIFPQYATIIRAWQYSTLPECKKLAKRRKRLLKMVGEKNWVGRMLLLDPTVNPMEFFDYKQMTSWRWSTWMNALTRRHLEVMYGKLVSANQLEEWMLWTVYTRIYIPRMNKLKL